MMPFLILAAFLLFAFWLGASNELEHQYKPPRAEIPLQPLAQVIKLRLVKS